MKKTLTLIFCLLALFGMQNSLSAQVWDNAKAWQWAKDNPWYCGVNYIPACAINYTAMWDKAHFAPDVIDKELSLMEDIGMNCVRVVLQYIVYEDNPRHFLKAFNTFLKICDKHKIKVMPIFFDDCAFGVNTDPKPGVQPEPLEGWYAWAWSPSPGYTMVVDERTHGKLEKYVKDVMSRHKNDDRIFMWDLYNEPTNTTMPERSWPLLKKVFKWAREINPSQPITAGMWNGNADLENFLAENSDIITFHIYAPKAETERLVERLGKFGKPMICTEWMNRVAKSTIFDVLPVFKKAGCGCLLWGLVNGKTQTHLCWGHRPEQLPYTGPWQHDIFRGDFTPYDPAEIEFLKKTIAEQ